MCIDIRRSLPTKNDEILISYLLAGDAQIQCGAFLVDPTS